MNWFRSEHPQRVTLKTFTVLVGKAPTKSKRIRMAFTLDLGSGEVQGAPEWMQEARDFVMKTGQTVTENLTASAINCTFGDPNLFHNQAVEAPKCDLRKFVVAQAGEADAPDTLLSFTAYAPFSTDLNRWCGTMAGETFTATFDGALPDPGDVLALAPKEAVSSDEEEDEPEDVTPEDDYETQHAAACDPKRDAEFAEPAKGRRRKVVEELKAPTPESIREATRALQLM